MSAVPADQSGTASGLIATTRVVGQALSVAIAGAIFIGLGGAAAGARHCAGGIRPGRRVGLDGTFIAAIHAALLVSALLAAAGAVLSLARPQQRLVEASRPQVAGGTLALRRDVA